jgi:predicted permease
MTLFLDILTKVTLPIIVLAALGYLMQGKLKLDVPSLNRLQVYVIMPAFFVHFLSTAKQPLSAVWPIFTFGIVQFMILIPTGWLLVLLFRMRRSLAPMVGLGTAYANVGFFGVPVTLLAFGEGYLIYPSVLAAMMAILVSTIGVWVMAPAGTGGMLSKLKAAFATPLIPSIFVGLALRGFEVELPTLIGQPIQLIGSIFTPLALYTLGAQVAAVKAGEIEWGPQTLIIVLKFLFAPALSWWICHMMGLPRDATDVIVVASATPVGVLITIFALEFKNESNFISTAVVITTALSPIFVTAWIIATRLM